jgi:hypothetical protein
VAVDYPSSAIQGKKVFLWHRRAKLLSPDAERKKPAALEGFHEGPGGQNRMLSLDESEWPFHQEEEMPDQPKGLNKMRSLLGL